MWGNPENMPSVKASLWSVTIMAIIVIVLIATDV